MYVTRHTRIAAPLLDTLWELYERNYRDTAQATVTREALYRTEFEAALTDPSNRIWLLWKADEPIGIGVIASDISATRYLSRAYLEAHYPDKMARGLVRYVLFTVIDRNHAGLPAAVKLGRTGLALEAQEGALVVFDVPAKNYGERGNLAEMARRVAALSGQATLTEIEVQRYFALDFTAALDEPEISDEVAAAALDDVVTV
jgi:hypothetical protein